MTTLNEFSYGGWTPFTIDICPTRSQEEILILEQALKATPKTIADEAGLIVAKEYEITERENLTSLARLGINGLGAW